jgi:hypothetical protein
LHSPFWLPNRIGRKAERRWSSLAFVVTAYALSLVATWQACFDHVSDEVYLMIWEAREHDKPFIMRDLPISEDLLKIIASPVSVPEVVLLFVDFPGQGFGIYSSDLAKYLRDATSPVLVSMKVTYDLGLYVGLPCATNRGAQELGIGGGLSHIRQFKTKRTVAASLVVPMHQLTICSTRIRS